MYIQYIHVHFFIFLFFLDRYLCRHTYDGTRTDMYIHTLFSQLHIIHTCRGGTLSLRGRGSRLVNYVWYITYNTNFFSLWDQYINIIIIASAKCGE